MTLRHPLALALPLLGTLAVAAPASGQVAVSGNDNKVMLVNGVVTVVPSPPADTVSIIDLKASPPRVIAEAQAPVSVVGPPLSIAVTPDESLALVTASNKVDPNDRTKQTPDNRVSVIDLKASPPRVIATLEAGKGAAGVSINRQGTLALVSNLVDGTVSIFTIQGKTVTPAGTLEVGGSKAGGGMVAITPDGKTALVSRSADHKVSVLAIDGAKVEYTKRDMTAGVRPIVLDIASSGAYAVWAVSPARAAAITTA
jgi:DNA-binding beta-propeller fold protein YncE